MIDLTNGVPGLNGEKPRSYREFWPYYLSQHLHPMTERVHAAGTTAAIMTGLAAFKRGRWKIFAASPLLAYVPAFASHYLWEGNRPVTLGGNFLWSARADLEMVYKVITGRIERDVAAIRQALGFRPAEVTLADHQRLRPAA